MGEGRNVETCGELFGGAGLFGPPGPGTSKKGNRSRLFSFSFLFLNLILLLILSVRGNRRGRNSIMWRR